MRFALDKTTNKRIEPTKGASAICQCCGMELIAKCGRIKVHHWAHKNLRKCDRWWEHETEWHRNWKDEFPLDWQEVIKHDHENDKIHIADVFIPSKELVIEFQNSSISIDELQSRERFYEKMIWVVNARGFDLSVFPVELVKKELERDKPKYYGGRINSFFSIPNQLQVKLLRRRDEILNKVRLRGKLILDLMNELDQEVDRMVARYQPGDPKVNGIDPNSFKKILLDPIFKKIDGDISAYSNYGDDQGDKVKHFGYKWGRKRKAWEYAKAHIFFDIGEQLYWLKSDWVLRIISKEEFVEHYNK